MKPNKHYFIELEPENFDILCEDGNISQNNQKYVLKKNLDNFSEDTKLYWKCFLQTILGEDRTSYINDILLDAFCSATEVFLFKSRTFVKKALKDKEHFSDIKTDFLLDFKEKDLYEYLKAVDKKHVSKNVISMFNQKQNILNIKKGYIRNGKLRKDGFQEKELELIGHLEENLLYIKYHHSCFIDDLEYGRILRLSSCVLNNQNKTLSFNLICRNQNLLNVRKLMQKILPNKAYYEFDLQDFNSYFNSIEYDELDELIEIVQKENKKV